MAGPAGPRPKRSGEEFTRSHRDDAAPGSAAKKPRFDMRNPSALAPDAVDTDDVTLETDSIGRRGQQAKRNAVNIDGYGSDSSNEGFKARADAKAKTTQKSKDEEQDDMFAELEAPDGDDEEGADGKAKKKNVRFLDAAEIEGQAEYSTGGGHVSFDPAATEEYNPDERGFARYEKERAHDSSSESDVGDETRAGLDAELDEELGAGGKKKHAPKLDAFNLRDEQEGGKFDEQGNYVRQAVDPDAVHDVWLEGVSKREMRRAKEAHAKREAERREKDRADDAKETADVLRNLIANMEIGETILEALARLGKGREKKKPKWQNQTKRKRQIEMDVDEPAEEDPAEKQRREAVEAITDAADLLLSRGEAEIYDTDRELLIRRYRQETGEDWEDPEDGEEEEDGRRWEYRWSGAEEVHGPYDRATMRAWSNAGYFGAGVEFRVVGDQGGKWSATEGF